MFSPVVFVLSLLAATRFALAGSPPPCLLAAVNTQPNPADIKGICSQNATQVENTIASVCSGNDTTNALSAFYATCSSASVSVSTYVPSSSGGSADKTATLSNGGAAATATTTGSGTKSSGSGTAASTGAAGKVELGYGAAIALAAAGLLNVV